MEIISFLLLAILWVSPCAFAQSIDIGRYSNDVSHPIDLVLDISVDQVQNPAPAGLTVQLYDPAAMGSMSQGSRQTDGTGRVLFHTSDGIHQVRISGPGIEPYEATVQIMRQEGQHAEHITVRSDTSAGPRAALPAVSVSRLNIPDKAAKEFRAGSKALEEKNYLEAKKRFTNATAIYGDYDVAYNGLGVAQMAFGDAPAARASFQKAIQIDDHFAEAYRNLARIALADHKYDEMDDLLTKSLQTEPLNAWALTYAAYAELQTQKFELAITHARAAHSVPHPGLASVHIVAAHALEATKQPGEALKEYRLYLEEDPNGRDAPQAKKAVAKFEASPAP